MTELKCPTCTDALCCICQGINDTCPDQPNHPGPSADAKRIKELEAEADRLLCALRELCDSGDATGRLIHPGQLRDLIRPYLPADDREAIVPLPPRATGGIVYGGGPITGVDIHYHDGPGPNPAGLAQAVAAEIQDAHRRRPGYSHGAA